MRCTRCDRIAVPQAVGLTREGQVVFGWCLTCLAEQGCTLVEIPGAGPFARRGRRGRRVRRRARRVPRTRSRRLALVLVAAVMAAWAAVLMVVGAGLRVPSLLAGGGVMAVTSLALGLASLDRGRGPLIVLKVVQVAAAVVTFGVPALAIARYDPRRNPLVVGTCCAALAVAWAARRGEQTLRRGTPTRSILPDL
ncbi:MAG TPA: hypothetical protein VF590_10290 [Isosphaeraceae bacterium]